MRIRVSRTLGAVMAAAALGLSACATQTDSTTHRGVGEYTEDAALTAKGKTAIASDAGLGTATAIDVTNYRGVVQLSAFSDNTDTIKRAAAAARTVDGVRSAVNTIKVKPPS